jgi:hypothetical protein
MLLCATLWFGVQDLQGWQFQGLMVKHCNSKILLIGLSYVAQSSNASLACAVNMVPSVQKHS